MRDIAKEFGLNYLIQDKRSPPSYTLVEIEALAQEFVNSNDASADLNAPDAIKLRMFMGAFIAHLTRRERAKAQREKEGRDER